MEDSGRQMEYSRPRRAMDDAENSMGMMNQVVIGLLTAAEQQGQGQGGGSSQQMRQLAQDQSRLNAQTDEMRQRLQSGGLSEAERRQLAQLKAMQQQIREQLEKFQRQVEDQRKILGDLDRIGEDMEKVAEDLEGGRLEGATRELQQKILSRLLDAERSMRERDFAKHRESREGRELYGEQGGSRLAEGLEEQQKQLRRWLAPEKAPPDYQDEVRRYFRRIQGELEGEGER